MQAQGPKLRRHHVTSLEKRTARNKAQRTFESLHGLYPVFPELPNVSQIDISWNEQQFGHTVVIRYRQPEEHRVKVFVPADCISQVLRAALDEGRRRPELIPESLERRALDG